MPTVAPSCCLFALLSCAGLVAQDRLTPELLWELGRVGDPQIAPDGSRLLYHVRRFRLAENRGTTHVFVLDLQDGGVRQLTTQGSNSNARWSPDGKRVAFVSTRSGSPQIWTIAVDGGEAEPVTDHPGGVANLAWAPDGRHFSFTAEVAVEPEPGAVFPDLPKAQALVYDDLMVRHWDAWEDGKRSHLFVVPVGGGPARDLMAGHRVDTPLRPFGGGEQIAWSPDGRELCYVAKHASDPENSTDSDLFVVSVDGGPHENITRGMPGYETNPNYSPDGRTIAFASMARAGYEADRNRLMAYSRADGTIRELAPAFDLSVAEFAWAPDASGLFLTADVRGAHHVFSVSAQGGEPRRVTAGRYHFESLVPSPAVAGAALYALRQRTERPFEVVRIGADTPASGTAVTDVNGAVYAKLALPTVEERWFPATDGQRIHAWVVLPPGFERDRKYPMLLYCQGGPQSQVGQWFSYRWNFHLMAAQGYVVLAVNRRGLPGFGSAWNEQISRDWGGQAMQDLLSATDAMFEEPYVDRERTAAVGASFGGYTVYWLMGNDRENRFRAMIAHCGVFNLESMYLSTEELFFTNQDLGGPFWQDSETLRDYQRFSPHRFAQHWSTPLLVIHGQKDFRVPVEQGLQAFTAAQIRGVPSRFLYFPDEGHWVLSAQNGVLWHRVFFDWLDRHCKGARDHVDAEPGRDVRRHLLEQVDDTAVVQLYADGFDQLSLDDKLLCYHLANAAIAGRDIFIDQKFAHALAVRDVLEELYLHRSVLAPATATEVERYTKLFWVHNGIHNAISSKKEILRLDRPAFTAAIAAARADGAAFPPEDRLATLFEIMTDPESYAMCTNKSPADDGDPIAASCNNLYVGVTSEDLEGFTEHHPLNSRLVKRPDGTLVEEVYRAGDGASIPPGRYAAELERVIRSLELAITKAPEPTANALRHLVRYCRTGSPEDWRAYNIAWVADGASVVDTINGFVEVYLDARGQKGAWEAVVSFLNRAATGDMEKLAANAQWFEERMPWAAEFKKPDVKGIVARAISVITETGDSGPITPVGINLPNEADIRRDHGSKSVNLSNVVKGYELAGSGTSAAEFAWSPEEVARAAKWGALAGDIHTNLHEVVGHASGQQRIGVDRPERRLGRFYSTLEEARADLVALYWITDPKLRDLGIVPHEDAALAEYESYARNALVQLRRVPRGHRLEEDHMRNRQLVVHWLIEHGEGAVVVERRDGKTFYRVGSVAAFRSGCGRLLAEVMRIKGTGDHAAGKELVEKYGTYVDPALHEEVRARIQKLRLPSATGFVQPELRLRRDASGAVVDVEVFYPQDLAAQMLRWSGRGT